MGGPRCYTAGIVRNGRSATIGAILLIGIVMLVGIGGKRLKQCGRCTGSSCSGKAHTAICRPSLLYPWGLLYAVSYKRNVGGLVSKAMGASGRRKGLYDREASGRTPHTATGVGAESHPRPNGCAGKHTRRKEAVLAVPGAPRQRRRLRAIRGSEPL